MRLPTFSRRSAGETPTEERSVAGGSTVAKPDDTTTRHFKTPAGPAASHAKIDDRHKSDRDKSDRDRDEPETLEMRPAGARAEEHEVASRRVEEHEVTGPKARVSMVATIALILGVAAALLVLSGPLLGYGIVVGGLALVLSLCGIVATRKRHVAGKSIAMLGMVLSLAAIVVGVLALTGSLSWLGTDMQPVNSAREWLDARFVDRF